MLSVELLDWARGMAGIPLWGESAFDRFRIGRPDEQVAPPDTGVIGHRGTYRAYRTGLQCLDHDYRTDRPECFYICIMENIDGGLPRTLLPTPKADPSEEKQQKTIPVKESQRGEKAKIIRPEGKGREEQEPTNKKRIIDFHWAIRSPAIELSGSDQLRSHSYVRLYRSDPSKLSFIA